MTGKRWLFRALLVVVVVQSKTRADENIADEIRSLREQVNALLDHRQQDYNALEGSLKRAMEKNTELFVLKNEVKQLRKEVNAFRGGNGNEAKNERLRVRWLGSAVTELQGEVAEVLRTRNASEELAERSRMRGELALLKGDVAAVGRGVRNLGGRMAKIEAVLGTIRVDIVAVKERFGQLSRTCADIASQLSAVQVEVKSLGCELPSGDSGNSIVHRGEKNSEGEVASSSSTATEEDSKRFDTEHSSTSFRRRLSRRHGYSRRIEEHRMRTEERLKNLEHKVSLLAQRRVLLEKRLAYEKKEWPLILNKRMKSLEKSQAELSRRLSNVTEDAVSARTIGESFGLQLIDSLRVLGEAVEKNNSETKRELVRLGVNAARKGAELSLTREELSNLRRAVQALSVSASKLQERSDGQQEAIDRLNVTCSEDADRFPSSSSSDALKLELELEKLDDQYHLIVNSLPENCEDRSTDQPARDGLRLLEAGRSRKPMLVYCRDGWTVVARRRDGALDFDRTWKDYSLGFGSPVGEYWIGNELLHELTRDNCTRLRVDMLDIYGERWRAEYESFEIDSAATGYRLRVDGYAGNATDALSYQNGMAFSAKDRDMDASKSHCASNYHGGWWFSRCQHANLNGKYSLGLTWFRSDTNQWMSIASSEMSVRRNSNCRRSR
ncbi:protein scabrous-like [Hylaeus anthracinus]|uniref:protein scabrous-like n=1 Tax=Hylaeus anthracinus TaxID=313031 RepID=UPI0023B8BD1F|nr:protein scabrous-like [Hylaeus anthracinus]